MINVAGAAQHISYKKLLSALVDARKSKGLSQAKLADLLAKPPSFVAKYELGERRLDVIELMVILQALDVETSPFLKQIERELPQVL